MADPEGHEFCCFVREPAELPAYRLHGIVVDCLDPAAQAAWWGRVLGRDVTTYEGHDWRALEGATPDPVLTLDFVPVPEARVGPNRVHWDLTGEVGPLLALGATPLWETEGSDRPRRPRGQRVLRASPTAEPRSAIVDGRAEVVLRRFPHVQLRGSHRLLHVELRTAGQSR